jgi:hypothetical protein
LYLFIFLHYIALPVFYLSCNEDQPQLQSLQPDDPAHNPADSGSNDMLHPHPPLTLQPQPAPAPFNFGIFMHESGGNTATLLSAIRNEEAHLPAGPNVVYSERAGAGVR